MSAPFELDAARALATGSALLAGDWIRAAKATLLAACEEIAALRSDLDAPIGCADHSCDVEPPTGQGTNGHCYCDEHTLRRAVRKMRREITRHAAERELLLDEKGYSLFIHSVCVKQGKDIAERDAELAAWREVTGADTPQQLAAELADTRALARGKPTRGDLSYVSNKAGATRHDAEEAYRKAQTAVNRSHTAEHERCFDDAEAKLAKAVAEERAARGALAAFERAHGLPITCREHDGDTTATPAKEVP